MDALQIVSLTDPGQVRDRNEDHVEVCPELGLVVLADGMGGYNAGDVASAMATSVVAAGMAETWAADRLVKLDRAQAIALSQSLLKAQAGRANAAIYARSQEDPACAGMCTTLVACLFYDDFVSVAHIGDSRLYRLRNDELVQITRDHSLLQEQIDCGMIRKDEAHLSHNRNVVTRAVGIDPDVETEIHTYDAQPGDIYLLCSDGLHGMITDEDMQLTLSALKANLDLSADQLVQAANDAGGHDNVSVILVRVPAAADSGS